MEDNDYFYLCLYKTEGKDGRMRYGAHAVSNKNDFPPTVEEFSERTALEVAAKGEPESSIAPEFEEFEELFSRSLPP